MAVHRFYDPDLGRWLNRDPLENAEMSQGPNLYAYVGNNAVNETDPLGLCPGDWWDLLWQFLLGAEEGAYASIDSAIPFWDPFANRYNLNDAGLGFSYNIGGPALQIVGSAGLGNLLSAVRGTSSISSTVQGIDDYIGAGGKAFRNDAGDLIIQSRNGLREVRFDINNPAPHTMQHTHIIEYAPFEEWESRDFQSANLSRWLTRKNHMAKDEFKMVQECVSKYEARRTPEGELTIEINVPKRFADLWLIKLGELVTTAEEINRLCDDESGGSKL